MNILVISDKLYPDEYGGSCTVTYKLIEQWQENNSVDIFTCKKTKTSNDTLFNNKVHRDFIKSNPIFSAKCLRKVLEENDYDVIVTHSVFAWFIYYLATLFKDKYCNNNVYNVFHGPWHKEAILKYSGNNSNLKKFFIPKMMYKLEKLYCKKNNNFIFLSKYMQDELALIDNKIKNKNCYFIEPKENTYQSGLEAVMEQYRYLHQFEPGANYGFQPNTESNEEIPMDDSFTQDNQDIWLNTPLQEKQKKIAHRL